MQRPSLKFLDSRQFALMMIIIINSIQRFNSVLIIDSFFLFQTDEDPDL